MSGRAAETAGVISFLVECNRYLEEWLSRDVDQGGHLKVKRKQWEHLVRLQEREGHMFPADLMNQAYNAAHARPPAHRAKDNLPLDDYLAGGGA